MNARWSLVVSPIPNLTRVPAHSWYVLRPAVKFQSLCTMRMTFSIVLLMPSFHFIKFLYILVFGTFGGINLYNPDVEGFPCQTNYYPVWERSAEDDAVSNFLLHGEYYSILVFVLITREPVLVHCIVLDSPNPFHCTSATSMMSHWQCATVAHVQVCGGMERSHIPQPVKAVHWGVVLGASMWEMPEDQILDWLSSKK